MGFSITTAEGAFGADGGGGASATFTFPVTGGATTSDAGKLMALQGSNVLLADDSSDRFIVGVLVSVEASTATMAPIGATYKAIASAAISTGVLIAPSSSAGKVVLESSLFTTRKIAGYTLTSASMDGDEILVSTAQDNGADSNPTYIFNKTISGI